MNVGRVLSTEFLFARYYEPRTYADRVRYLVQLTNVASALRAEGRLREATELEEMYRWVKTRPPSTWEVPP